MLNACREKILYFLLLVWSEFDISLLVSLQNLHDNSSLSGLLYELIIPAVRSKVPTLTEEGVYCLGLYCMLDQVRQLIQNSGVFW